MGNCLWCRDKGKHESEAECVVSVHEMHPPSARGEEPHPPASLCQRAAPSSAQVPTAPPDDSQSSASPRDVHNIETALLNESPTSAPSPLGKCNDTSVPQGLVSSTPPRVQSPSESSAQVEAAFVTSRQEEAISVASANEEITSAVSPSNDNPFTATPRDDTSVRASLKDCQFTDSRNNAEYDFSPREEVAAPPSEKLVTALAYDFSGPVAGVFKHGKDWTFGPPSEKTDASRVKGFSSLENGFDKNAAPPIARESLKPGEVPSRGSNTEDVEKVVDVMEEGTLKFRTPLLAPPADATPREYEDVTGQQKVTMLTEEAERSEEEEEIEDVAELNKGGEDKGAGVHEFNNAHEIRGALGRSREAEVHETNDEVPRWSTSLEDEREGDNFHPPARRENSVLSPLPEDKPDTAQPLVGGNEKGVIDLVVSTEEPVEQSKICKDSEAHTDVGSERLHNEQEGFNTPSEKTGDASTVSEKMVFVSAEDEGETSMLGTRNTGEGEEMRGWGTEGRDQSSAESDAVENKASGENTLAGIIRRQRDMEKQWNTEDLPSHQPDSLEFILPHDAEVVGRDLEGAGVSGNGSIDARLSFLQEDVSLDFGEPESGDIAHKPGSRVQGWSSVDSDMVTADGAGLDAAVLREEVEEQAGDKHVDPTCVDNDGSDEETDPQHLANIARLHEAQGEEEEEEEVDMKYSVDDDDDGADKSKDLTKKESTEGRVSPLDDVDGGVRTAFDNDCEVSSHDEKTESKSRSTSAPYRSVPIISPPLVTPHNGDDGEESLK